MQNHKNASFENDEYEILPHCDRNQLSGGDCQKFQETEEAHERKLTACGLTLALMPGAVEISGIEQNLDFKMSELHLNSSMKSEFQDDRNEPDICDLSGSYSSGFCFDKTCLKPLTSTPCSRKKRVSFQLAEDSSSMDDSGYDGSPTSEQESPIVSRKRNLEDAVQDSFEEHLGANLSLDLSSPRFCLLSRFDEPDSADESYSSSKSSSSLTHLTNELSKRFDGISEDKGKTETDHVWPDSTKDFQFSTKDTETTHLPPKLADVFHASLQNSGTSHVSHENTEIFHISPEKSVSVFAQPKNLTSRHHLPEKNDSGFVEELSDLFDASLNIRDLNVASILYANSSEFSLARKVMSTKEYNDRLMMTLRKFAPPCLDRLIGRKMGLDKVDVISELFFRNITGVLSAILNYLSDDDLQSMSDVSVCWKATVKCISYARYKKHRRHQHPSQRAQQIDRENNCIERSEHRLVTIAPEPLLQVQVQSVMEVKVSTKSIPNRTEQFWQEASKLKNHESLRKCPRCRYPSRVDTAQERAWCSDSKCLYDFCIRCLAPFHSLRPCVGAKHKQSALQKEIKICSRQSKRNLRRL